MRRFDVGEFAIASDCVCHPGPTVGYRIESAVGVVAYLPDHEPALGVGDFPRTGEWTSGYALAAGADLLMHDAQYTADEYGERVGWGHSAIEHTRSPSPSWRGAKHLVTFHHDPAHDDWEIDQLTAAAVEEVDPRFIVTPGTEGSVFAVGEPDAGEQPK